MAYIIERRTKRGSSFLVRWRDPATKKLESITFHSRAEADLMAKFLTDNGNVFALAQAGLLAARGSRKTVSEQLDEYIAGNTSASDGTLTKYWNVSRDHLKPMFGSLAVESISSRHLVDWIRWMQSRGKSAKTIANAHGILSAALRLAVRDGIIESNPCAATRLPKDRRAGDRQICLTRREAALIIECLREDYRDFVRLLLATGMRFGEATALRPGDVRKDERPVTVTVERAWTRDGQGRPVLGPTKTRRGRRTIGVDEATGEMLARRSSSSLEERLLFTTPTGAQIQGQYFHTWVWKPALAKAVKLGLTRKPRVHDLRHTHASWMLGSGMSLFELSRRLGHENISTTADIYGHLADGAQTRAAEIADRALGGLWG